jgi:LacI family transcriptional regulator
VAKEAQTSTSTASRALTGRGYVAQPLRERVLSAARTLGYVPDANARSLKRRRAHAVGVVISDLGNIFYAEIASGIEEVVRRHGYNVVLANSDGDPHREAAVIDQFREMRIPGLIITPSSPGYRARLAGDDMAVVEVDRRMAKPAADAVLLDNDEGAFVATKHLIELGHRRIAVLCGESHWTTARERLAGYRRALRAASIPFDPALVAHATFHPEHADTATNELLDRSPRFTAIFAMNNVLALGAVTALRRRRGDVKNHISVVGFDDLPWMALVEPSLTTVTQPAPEMGRRAAMLLFERLDKNDLAPRTVRLLPSLIVRESTAGPTTME